MSDSDSNPFGQQGPESNASVSNREFEDDMADEFEPKAAKENEGFFQIYGMYFCMECKNIMEPLKTNSDLLEFKCKRCIEPIVINFKSRENNDCMLYSKSLQSAGSRKIVIDERIVLDQTMPRLTTECPDCGFHEAAYMATSDEGERKMLLKLVCARGADKGTVKCGTQWDLEEDLHIFRSRVLEREEFKSAQDIK